MELLHRNAKYILNPITQIHYAIETSYKESYFPHMHDFYELLLTVKGCQLLIVNKKKLILKESILTLLRPQDIHYKKYLEDGLHINVCFSQETMNELLNYLGEGFPHKMLLESSIPPYVILTPQEKAIIQTKLENLNLIDINEIQIIKTNLRMLLFELLTKYFTKVTVQQDNVPSWIATIVTEMKKKENFRQGLPKLLELSGVAHEHLCRLFKKFLNTTPTNFINEQRLNYATNLLLHSDMDITNVALESGFSNLSYFHHIFKEKFHTTPIRYKKQFSAIININNKLE
jgi:AraC family cel operon transcriptional repressor